MSFPDWGSVPAWLGAGSLLLAYRVFIRDRVNADRAQVDRVGVWGKTTHERKAPGDKARVDTGEVRLFARNATDLPIEVRQVAYEIHTNWLVPDLDQCTDPDHPDVWLVEAGTRPEKCFVERIRVPPQETWEQSFPISFAHLAPERASQPEWFHGVVCEISWILVVDNAGRRWELRPARGQRARRIRRYRPREYQPARW
jgi:hypothetical protein